MKPTLPNAFPAEAEAAIAGAPLPHESAHLHVAGEATYVDDIVELTGTLHAALGLSARARARLRAIKARSACAGRSPRPRPCRPGRAPG